MAKIKKCIINGIFVFLIILLNFTNTSFANIQTETERNEILSKKENWISGYYYSWGGSYAESTSSYCLKDAIYIDPGEYHIIINDSRFQLGIHQFDEEGKWINNYKSELVDGKTITILDNTSYIKVNLSSKVWGINPCDYFDYGLFINISKEYNTESMEKIELNNADLKDVTKIKSGLIVTKTGKVGLDLNKVYYNNYFSVDNTKYVVNLPDPHMSMQIIEFDENDNILTDSSLRAGRTWEKQEQTSYIGINISASKEPKLYTYEDYIEALSNYDKPCLTKYKKYVHNTEFDTNFKAYDFAKTMNIGWNLGDALGSGYCEQVGEDANLLLECSWGNPYITKDLIDCVAAQGFNTIRMPVTWYPNCSIDENGHYVIGKKWLSRVQDVVDYAIENDMYVIINTMCDEGNLFYVGVEDETEWAKVLQSGTDLWSQIAEYFKDYDEHLIFESYNELGTKAGWTYSKLATTQINELNQVFTDAVRNTGGNNKYRLLMIPTYTTSSKENITADFELPEDESPGRTMISTHVYNAMYDEDIEWKFQSLEEFSIRVDAPIIIGEFGLNSKSQFQNLRATHMSNYLARATSHGLKCCVWDDNYSWQLINRWNLTDIKTDLIKAMFDGFNKGIAYRTTKNKVYYTDINQFHIGGLSLADGTVTNTDYSTTWWGGLVPLNDSRTSTRVEIPDNTDYISFNIKTTKEASEVWIVGATWFDKDGNYLTYSKSKEITSRYKLMKVPDGAKYFSACFHDPYINHTVAEYGKWLKEGKVALDITYIDEDDMGLEQEIVDVSNYNYNNRTITEIVESKQRENFDDCDLDNIYSWVSGTYLKENGNYKAWANRICLKDYKTVKAGTEYNIKISNDNYKLNITELDKDFNFIKINQNLSNGDTYIIPDDIKYISLSLFGGDDMKFNDYKEAFNNGTIVVDLENLSEEEEQKPVEEEPKDDESSKEEQKPAEEEPKDDEPSKEEEQKPAEEEPKDDESSKEEQKPSEEEPKDDEPSKEEEQKPAEEEPKDDEPSKEEEQKPAEEEPKDDEPSKEEEQKTVEEKKKDNSSKNKEQKSLKDENKMLIKENKREEKSEEKNQIDENEKREETNNGNQIAKVDKQKDNNENNQKENMNNSETIEDNTMAEKPLPATGAKKVGFGCLILALLLCLVVCL